MLWHNIYQIYIVRYYYTELNVPCDDDIYRTYHRTYHSTYLPLYLPTTHVPGLYLPPLYLPLYIPTSPVVDNRK